MKDYDNKSNPLDMLLWDDDRKKPNKSNYHEMELDQWGNPIEWDDEGEEDE